MTSISKPEKENRRAFAITSLRKSRWYWVVWPSFDEVHASAQIFPHVGEGYEETKSEAVKKALALAGEHAESIAVKYAKIYHRDKTGVKWNCINPRNSEPSRIPKTQGFLYRDVYDQENKKWIPVPHRVARKTRKFVFVEQHPYSPDGLTGSWLDLQNPTFRFDRRLLEKEGYAFVPATGYVEDAEEFYFINEREKPSDIVQFECLEALNLSWPSTEAQVKRAYRKLAKSAHPDGGGTQEKFLALQKAYEQALQLSHQNSNMSQSTGKH